MRVYAGQGGVFRGRLRRVVGGVVCSVVGFRGRSARACQWGSKTGRVASHPAVARCCDPAAPPHPYTGVVLNAHRTRSTLLAGPRPAAPTAAMRDPWCHVAEAWNPSSTLSLNSSSLRRPRTAAYGRRREGRAAIDRGRGAGGICAAQVGGRVRNG